MVMGIQLPTPLTIVELNNHHKIFLIGNLSTEEAFILLYVQFYSTLFYKIFILILLFKHNYYILH